MPLRHRPDFKQALSTLERLQQEAREEPQVPLLTLTNTNNGRHAVHLLHGEIGTILGGLLVIPKVKKEMHQVLSERSDLLLASIWQACLAKDFHEFNLICDRLIV